MTTAQIIDDATGVVLATRDLHYHPQSMSYDTPCPQCNPAGDPPYGPPRGWLTASTLSGLSAWSDEPWRSAVSVCHVCRGRFRLIAA